MIQALNDLVYQYLSSVANEKQASTREERRVMTSHCRSDQFPNLSPNIHEQSKRNREIQWQHKSSSGTHSPLLGPKSWISTSGRSLKVRDSSPC